MTRYIYSADGIVHDVARTEMEDDDIIAISECGDFSRSSDDITERIPIAVVVDGERISTSRCQKCINELL